MAKVRVSWMPLLAFVAALFAVGCSGNASSGSETSSGASAISSDAPSDQLERLVLGAAFSGIDVALSSYDDGKLQFLNQAYTVIGNLPYDPRIESFIQKGNDLWFPIFCTRLVMLQRLLGLPTTNDGSSQCLQQIANFESQVGTLVQIGEADLQKALSLIPGATFTDKLQSLGTFYANFGGQGATIDDKVNTAIALGRVFLDYQNSGSAGGTTGNFITFLSQNQNVLVKEAQTLSGTSGYIDGSSYLTFFQQIDTTDLRNVVRLLLQQSPLSDGLQEAVLNIYDNNLQGINATLFSAAYRAAQQPYSNLLQQLGVEFSTTPSFEAPIGQPGGAIKISDLLSLWNQAFNGNSSQMYGDLYRAIANAASTGAMLPPTKSINVRTGFLRRFSFPNGLPAQKLANAVQQGVLPLDLIVSSPDSNTVVIQ